MYIEVVVAVEAHEIMPVALVITEEEVLAVYASVVLPPLLCLLYGLPLGMVIACEGNRMFIKIGKHRSLPIAYNTFLFRYIFHIICFERRVLRF